MKDQATKIEETKELGHIATAEQIKEWKRLHGDVHRMQVHDKACYLRKPTRKILAMVHETVPGSDYLGRQELKLENCWLAGDEEIKTNDDYFLNACTAIDDLIPTYLVELAKK